MAEYPTLMDVARRSGSPSTKKIVEVLNKNNDILDDIPWIPCNSGVVHKTTLRASIPTPTWRMLNKGVPVTKSATKQVTVGCGMLETYAEVDAKQVKLAAAGQVDDASSSAAASNAIAGENEAYIEGFGQEISRVIFYGDPAKPQEPVGLVHYYNDRTGETQNNIINGGALSGATDCTSMWLVAWDPTGGVHGIFPNGSQAGLSEKFLGEVTKEENGELHQIFRTHYTWDAGIVVRHPKCAVRICNIDMSDLIAGNTSAADLIDLMIKSLYRIPREARHYRMAFYARPEVIEALDRQTRKTTNLQLSWGEVYGRNVLTFRNGIPVREQESLLATEARI